jgi:hypothetical protein
MRRAKDGHQARCRDCCKHWYLENAAEQKARVAKRNKRHRLVAKEWLGAFLQEHPCVDCGEDDIRCLDFDHRPGSGKLKAIAVLLQQSASLAQIKLEIEKCDVRCSNCHRRRTTERGNFWRQGAFEQSGELRREASVARLSRLLVAARD